MTAHLNITKTTIRAERRILSLVKFLRRILGNIYSVLEGDFLKTEDLNSSDGTGWEIEYFNESGKVIHQFYGYIYGYDIEQVIELLNQYLSG